MLDEINDNPIVKSILEDHKKFLLFQSEVAGYTIKDTDFTKVRSLLSPAYKNKIFDPISMTPEIINHTNLYVDNYLVFPIRGQIRLFVKYIFPGFETAACREFLFKAGILRQYINKDIIGVEHSMFPGLDIAEKIFGICCISRTNFADIVYRELCELLEKPQ